MRRGLSLFLTRPRRIGKSLLLWTLAALCQGRRNLFADTGIGQEGRWDGQGRMRPGQRVSRRAG